MRQEVLVAAVLCLGVGFGLGWWLGPASTEGGDAPAPLGDGEGTKQDPGGPTLGDDRTRIALLEKQLEAERTLAARLEQKVTSLEEEKVALEAAAAAAGRKPSEDGPKYPFPAHAEAFADVKWGEMGDAVFHMGPLLAELADSMRKGEGLPSSIGDLQRWNGPLLTTGLELNRKGVPGTGVNGSFTHPSVLVNMVHSALIAGGQPLDEAQSQQVGKIGRAYAAEDERQRAAFDEHTLGIEKVVAEARLKERFYAELDALLTPAQRDVLHPEAVRGRASLDLFSSGLVLAQVCRAVRFATREELAQELVKIARVHFQVGDDQIGILQEEAARWAQSFDQAWLFEPPDALALASLDLPGNLWLPTSRLLVSAERARDLYRGWLDRLDPQGALAKKVRAEVTFAVPVLKVP
jgi:hypothetical protein